jgi:peptidoglycan hydrolase CwlO-like protein
MDSLDQRVDVLEKELRQAIKDIAHLKKTIKALTFVLQKNKAFDPEDKKYIDSYLDGK